MLKLTEQFNALGYTRPIDRFDDVAVPLPNASFLGYGEGKCKRGYYFLTAEGACGRSLGRVTVDGEVFICAFVLIGLDNPVLRWIRPGEVAYAAAQISSAAVRFFFDPEMAQDPIKALREHHHGFRHDAWISDKEK